MLPSSHEWWLPLFEATFIVYNGIRCSYGHRHSRGLPSCVQWLPSFTFVTVIDSQLSTSFTSFHRAVVCLIFYAPWKTFVKKYVIITDEDQPLKEQVSLSNLLLTNFINWKVLKSVLGKSKILFHLCVLSNIFPRHLIFVIDTFL